MGKKYWNQPTGRALALVSDGAGWRRTGRRGAAAGLARRHRGEPAAGRQDAALRLWPRVVCRRRGRGGGERERGGKKTSVQQTDGCVDQCSDRHSKLSSNRHRNSFRERQRKKAFTQTQGDYLRGQFVCVCFPYRAARTKAPATRRLTLPRTRASGSQRLGGGERGGGGHAVDWNVRRQRGPHRPEPLLG